MYISKKFNLLKGVVKLQQYLELLKSELNIQITFGDEENNYYGKNELIFCCLVTGHSGTENRHMLRADFHNFHDRWSNCWFEEFFTNEEEFKKALNLLKDFQLNEDYLISDYEREI